MKLRPITLVLAALTVAGTASAQTGPETAAEAEEAEGSEWLHGSGRGDGDSRGGGRGDGRGRERAGLPEPSEPVTLVEPPPEPASEEAAPPASPLTIPIGEDFELTPTLEHRVRYYFRQGFDFAPGGATHRVRQRARLGADLGWRRTVGVYVQLQDVRSWGEEADTRTDFRADGFDAHQAYTWLRPVDELTFKLGRQEIDLATYRLLGKAEFAEQGRSFDALSAHFEAADVTVDLAYALVRDYAEMPINPPGVEGKRHLGIIHVHDKLFRWLEPGIIATLDGDTSNSEFMATFGLYVRGAVGRTVELSYRGEGYLQYGDRGPAGDHEAYLVNGGGRATVDVYGRPYVDLEATLHSGDPDPNDTTTRTFLMPHARRHLFYGFMDRFLDFPQDTDARGLRDVAMAIGWAPEDINTAAILHLFDAAADRGDGLNHWGYEVDFVAAYQLLRYMNFEAKYGFFVPAELMRPDLDDPDVEHMFLLTAGAKL